jgi:hypothetical protein
MSNNTKNHVTDAAQEDNTVFEYKPEVATFETVASEKRGEPSA